jgi:hypothetical protein
MKIANPPIRFPAFLFPLLVCTFGSPVESLALTCTVTTTADSAMGLPAVPDSLRDCLERVVPGDTITFDPVVFDLVNSEASTTIDVTHELPAMDDGNVTIDASNRRVTVNGSGANSASGLVIASSDNEVMGLTLVAFENSGIVVQSGSGNTLGGPRSLGGGPNGQGLRISSCGSFGIELTGSGTTANVVKGCWIGLDASGGEPLPNLVGLGVHDGSSTNTIGSPVADEANIISGNAFEGVTVSGIGTDDNVIIGNVIGAGATVDSAGDRTALGNGSSGVFLSRGTKSTRVGGEDTGESNHVAFNGGNGVEVRATSSRRNSARTNSVYRNKKGGIALFDGSNDGIQAPKITSVQVLGPSSLGTGLTLRIAGESLPGIVDLFSDSGGQGKTYRANHLNTGGAWAMDVDASVPLTATATLTDALGNTSRFGVFGLATDDDSDADGVSDVIEDLAGTDPDDLLDAPALAGPLNVTKMSIKLSFASSGKDSIKMSSSVVLPADFSPEGTPVGVYVAGHSESLVLDADGKASTDNSSVSLKTSISSGPTLSYRVARASLQAAVDAAGLGGTTTIGEEQWVLPVVVTLGDSVSFGAVSVQYKATQGKSGKAKLSK